MKLSPIRSTIIICIALTTMYGLIAAIKKDPKEHPIKRHEYTSKEVDVNAIDIECSGTLFLSSTAKTVTITSDGKKHQIDTDGDQEVIIDSLIFTTHPASLHIDIEWEHVSEQNFMMIELYPITGDGALTAKTFTDRSPSHITFSTEINWNQ